MSKPAWMRSSDEARAGGGGNFLNDKSDKAAEEEESSEGGALTKKKTQTYQSHLKLVDKRVDTISAPTTSLEAPPAHNVDIRTAGVTKHSDGRRKQLTSEQSRKNTEEEYQTKRKSFA